jgi:hypothetical protein
MAFDLVQVAELAGAAIFGGVTIIATRKYEDREIRRGLANNTRRIGDLEKRIGKVENDATNDTTVRRMQIDAAVDSRVAEAERELGKTLGSIHRVQITILELLVDVARKAGVESRVTDALVKIAGNPENR